MKMYIKHKIKHMPSRIMRLLQGANHDVSHNNQLLNTRAPHVVFWMVFMSASQKLESVGRREPEVEKVPHQTGP